MILEHARSLFSRELTRLYEEIQLYSNEAVIWRTKEMIPNSAGNLCLHLVGNLNTYIGREIGETGYLRNREEEFSLKDVPRRQLLRMISDTMHVVDSSLARLSNSELDNEYPLLVLDRKTSTGYLLIHLLMHLSYHLGQINYHRRILDVQG